MAGIGDVVQKAFYLGVGLAAAAGERAGEKISELRSQAQKLAEEMVAKGEMTTDEAKRFVDDMIKQAQQPQVEQQPTDNTPKQPRQIEILSEEEEPAKGNSVDAMRQQVEALQEELRRLKRDRS
jgi:polyhydroxyalkanoate synthesis regulator phasin